MERFFTIFGPVFRRLRGAAYEALRVRAIIHLGAAAKWFSQPAAGEKPNQRSVDVLPPA